MQKISDFDKLFGTNNTIRMYITRNMQVHYKDGDKCITDEDAVKVLKKYLLKYPEEKAAAELMDQLSRHPEKKKPSAEPKERNTEKASVSSIHSRIDLMQITKGIFVSGLILFQAKIYASLAVDNFGDIGMNETMWFFAGVLIESAGVLIASNMKVKKDGHRYSLADRARIPVKGKGKVARTWWWFLFFLFQVGGDAAKLGIFNTQEWNQWLAKFLIMISIPGGILAYSHLFLNHNDNA